MHVANDSLVTATKPIYFLYLFPQTRISEYSGSVSAIFKPTSRGIIDSEKIICQILIRN